MKRITSSTLALLMLLAPAADSTARTPAPPPPPTGAKVCAADFEALEAKVRRVCAGFQDKVTGPGREAELDAFTERVRAEARAAADSAACTAALRRWAGFFRGRYLKSAPHQQEETK